MNSFPTIVLAGNGPYLNRGCEAIVRGTVSIVRRAFGAAKFINANFDGHNPPFMAEETDQDISHRPIAVGRRGIAADVVRRIANKMSPRWAAGASIQRIRESLSECDAVLSVGGDNYSLDYGVPWIFLALDDCVRRHGKTLVIWGASVGPFDGNPGFARLMHAHLRHEVTAIFVREKRSQQYLAANGIKDSVYLMPDPAFVMEPAPVTEEQIGFGISGGAIGFNFSPLLSRYTSNDGVVDLGTAIVERLRSTFERPVILVPHVMTAHTSDHTLLSAIYRRLHDPRDVFLLPGNLTAAQTKGVISRLGCLIGARTHATIASLSTGVPTVSLAYSVKAWGINEDVFGHTDYVISPENLAVDRVCAVVACVLRDEAHVRGRLQARIPSIMDAAYAAGRKLKTIMDESRPISGAVPRNQSESCTR